MHVLIKPVAMLQKRWGEDTEQFEAVNALRYLQRKSCLLAVWICRISGLALALLTGHLSEIKRKNAAIFGQISMSKGLNETFI